MQESQVARAEVGSRERVVETRPECLPAEVGLLPIAVRHAGSAYPDLAYLPIRQLEARCRIHDPQFLVVDDAPAAHCAGTILAFHRARGLRSPTTADHERRLGQAVARVERLLLKTTAGERVNEALQRGGAYRLCAIECDVPRRQIQPNALRGRDPLDAYVISEVGTSADRGPLAGDRLQPARWSSQKGHGGHQCNRKAALDPLQDAADQTHIVERRQPDDTTAVRVDLEAAFYLASVVQQVRMAHHDATRRSGRARCVLQNGQIVRRLHRLTPRLRHTDRQRFSRQPRYAAEVRLRGKHGSHLRLRSRGAECYRWPCVARDAQQARLPLPGRGHGDPARVQTTEQSHHEVHPWRVYEQRPVANRSIRLQQRRHPAGPRIELRVTQRDLVRTAVAQKTESAPVWRLRTSPPQHIDERRLFRCGQRHGPWPVTHNSPRGWILKVTGIWPKSSPSAWQLTSAHNTGSTRSSRHLKNSTARCPPWVPAYKRGSSASSCTGLTWPIRQMSNSPSSTAAPGAISMPPP